MRIHHLGAVPWQIALPCRPRRVDRSWSSFPPGQLQPIRGDTRDSDKALTGGAERPLWRLRYSFRAQMHGRPFTGMPQNHGNSGRQSSYCDVWRVPSNWAQYPVGQSLPVLQGCKAGAPPVPTSVPPVPGTPPAPIGTAPPAAGSSRTTAGAPPLPASCSTTNGARSAVKSEPPQPTSRSARRCFTWNLRRSRWYRASAPST